MLAGKAVGINTARKFIRYFTAEQAQALIDWEAIGKKNPLADEYPVTDNSGDKKAAKELLSENDRYGGNLDKDDEQ